MFQVEDLLHNDLSPLNKIVLEAGAKGPEREISWPNTIMTLGGTVRVAYEQGFRTDYFFKSARKIKNTVCFRTFFT